jgi:geranylgeranyl diphosphate synthase, type II
LLEKPLSLETLESYRTALYQTMLAALPKSHPNAELNAFYRLLRDYPERGGKQLRGLFVLLSCEAHGGNYQDALEVAAALELFQNWVLIHDDIEDGSETRRGSPTLHRQVGMPIALNVGDALHVYMWELLHRVKLPQREAIQSEFLELIHRTAEGQHLDLSWVAQNRFDISEQDYLEMVSLKTAYYTVISPLRLGALCSAREPDERLNAIGQALGMAFQIRDDVLNLSLAEGYGKEFAGDLYEAKRSLILAHLFSRVTAAEKRLLTDLLAKPRETKTPEDIAQVLALIKAYGSLSYAQTIAEAKAAEGLALLGQIADTLPGKTVARELAGLLESLALRSK